MISSQLMNDNMEIRYNNGVKRDNNVLKRVEKDCNSINNLLNGFVQVAGEDGSISLEEYVAFRSNMVIGESEEYDSK
jgi:hypothetical protein